MCRSNVRVHQPRSAHAKFPHRSRATSKRPRRPILPTLGESSFSGEPCTSLFTKFCASSFASAGMCHSTNTPRVNAHPQGMRDSHTTTRHRNFFASSAPRIPIWCTQTQRLSIRILFGHLRGRERPFGTKINIPPPRASRRKCVRAARQVDCAYVCARGHTRGRTCARLEML